jgi:hypothetical protein
MRDWLLIYEDTLVELSVKDANDDLETVFEYVILFVLYNFFANSNISLVLSIRLLFIINLFKNKDSVLRLRVTRWMQNDDNSKTIWCRFYLDDFNTVKVKIIHIGGGKYRVIEDREGGKYVGRIVDASEVDHFEI